MSQDWSSIIAKEFATVELGDKRLARRCEKLAKSVIISPDKSLPAACGNWANTKAAYRFFSNERVTREGVLLPHIDSTVERCNRQKAILAIQDTTSLNLTRHKATKGLGPIAASKKLRGMLVHTTMAVDADGGEVLGLLGQKVWVRTGYKPKGETWSQLHKRSRESQRWIDGVERTAESELACLVIAVFDREGEIFEAIETLQAHKQSFVIRASRKRPLANGAGYVLDAVRKASERGFMDVDIPARNGAAKRVAHLTLRSMIAEVAPPAYRKQKGNPIRVSVVAALEEQPPQGTDPLEWFLFTDEPCQTSEECQRVVRIYTYRWKIEEFHMGLKTGCRMEERQLQERQRLEALLGLFDVIAVMIVRLRDLALRKDAVAASRVLNATQLQLLHTKHPKLGPQPVAREALRAVAQLGGFLGRRSDGDPGWRTLWRGMHALLLMEAGYHLGLAGSSASAEICG